MSSTVYTTIPAYCPTCEKLYQNNAFALGPGTNINIKSCSTLCPVGHARTFSGWFIFTPRQSLQLSTNSPETLKLLISLAERAIAGEIDHREAIDKISKFAPSLSAAASQDLTGRLAYLTLLVYFITELLKAGLGSSSSNAVINELVSPVIINQLFDAII